MRRILLLLAVLALALPLAARADTVSIFNFTNATTNDGASGGVVTGTIDVDITTGVYSSINATYTSVNGTQTFTAINDFQGTFGGYFALFDSDQGDKQTPGGGQIDLYIPETTLVGYTGGIFCTGQCPSGTGGVFVYDGTPDGGFDGFTDGSLTFVSSSTTGPSPVPEPSSLALLGTGVLGAVGAVRRRLQS